MNEIERFKKNRMIGKYQLGKPITVGGVTYTPEGNNYVYYTNVRGRRLRNTISAAEFQKRRRTPAPTEETLGGYVREKNRSLFGSGYRWYDASKPNSAVAIDKEIEVGDWIIKPDGTKVHKSVRQLNLNGGRPVATAKKPVATNDSPATTSTPAAQPAATTRTVSRQRPNYAANFAGMNFTDAEKDFITKAGFDPTNAKSVQEFILSRAAGANLGARKGAGIADGYWGSKSAAAFQALRNQGIFNPVDATEPIKTVEEKPVDAPDYGYTTTNHYGNGRELKNMGFSNYAGLQKFAAGNDQFAKDLRQRFGQDVTKWDQAAVEGALGVSGRYRGSRSGDFGDMARSMQQWAAHQNLMHDINERWDRTGADGTEYSSREMREKFDNIKVSPEIKYGGGGNQGTKFDFSGMKFNTGFTGANTLGGAGATLGGGLSLGGNLSLGGGEIGGNPADNGNPANNMKQAKYADK